MSSYRLELEMRIMEVVVDVVTAEGLVKGGLEQSPDQEEAYLQLLEQVKNT